MEKESINVHCTLAYQLNKKAGRAQNTFLQGANNFKGIAIETKNRYLID